MGRRLARGPVGEESTGHHSGIRSTKLRSLVREFSTTRVLLCCSLSFTL